MPSIEYIRATNDDDLAYYPAPGEIFHMLANYGQHVMEIFVPITDNSIWIAPINDAESAIKTKGAVHRHQHLTAEDAVDEGVDPKDAEFQAMAVNNTMLSPLGVCMAALYGYVMPRAVALMARCYLPTPPASDVEMSVVPSKTQVGPLALQVGEVDLDAALEQLIKDEGGKNE